MKINTKILSVDPITGTAVVRFFTEVITEADLVSQVHDETGEILRCTTDYNCWLPREPLEGDALVAYFQRFAPVEHFDRMEKARAGTGIDTSGAAALIGQVSQPAIVTTTPTLAQAKADKKVAAKLVRQTKEGSAVLVGTVAVATDPESQGKINGALTALQNGFLRTVQWKGDNGWVELDLDAITAVARAVSLHVQRCFTWEKTVIDQIDAATTVDEVNAINFKETIVV